MGANGGIIKPNLATLPKERGADALLMHTKEVRYGP